jgi:hypothetical protein
MSSSTRGTLDRFGNKAEYQMKLRCTWDEAFLARDTANKELRALVRALYTAGRSAAEARSSAAEARCQATLAVLEALELAGFEAGYYANHEVAEVPNEVDYTTTSTTVKDVNAELELAVTNIVADDGLAFGEATEPGTAVDYQVDQGTTELYEHVSFKAQAEREAGEFNPDLEISCDFLKFQKKNEKGLLLGRAAAVFTNDIEVNAGEKKVPAMELNDEVDDFLPCVTKMNIDEYLSVDEDSAELFKNREDNKKKNLVGEYEFKKVVAIGDEFYKFNSSAVKNAGRPPEAEEAGKDIVNYEENPTVVAFRNAKVEFDGGDLKKKLEDARVKIFVGDGDRNFKPGLWKTTVNYDYEYDYQCSAATTPRTSTREATFADVPEKEDLKILQKKVRRGYLPVEAPRSPTTRRTTKKPPTGRL